MYIVFYGPEGSGKGTQANLLSQKVGITLLGSGDLVRKYAKEDHGIMGRICKESLQRGHYVADSEMYVLWKQRFKEQDTRQGWVLDGFPRNLTQAKFLARKVEKYGQAINAVFFLDVSRAESLRRLLKRGRKSPDGSNHDSPERIRERLEHYTKGKEAVLRYYKKRGVLVHINGERPVDKIHKEITKTIKGIQEKMKSSEKGDIERSKQK
ncbi:nucleoside monophosphate kinase [Patescibacteria group bacterium]|nr:nucleoside monophosphate kinase [Patescibacteria group bacterium]